MRVFGRHRQQPPRLPAGNNGPLAYPRRRVGSIAITIAAAAALAGCPAIPEGFDSPDPHARLRAIVDADPDRDVPDLIEQLDAADPAARLLAERRLVEIAGEDFGYHHWDPSWRRRDAIERWRRWAVEQGYAPEP